MTFYTKWVPRYMTWGQTSSEKEHCYQANSKSAILAFLYSKFCAIKFPIKSQLKALFTKVIPDLGISFCVYQY